MTTQGLVLSAIVMSTGLDGVDAQWEKTSERGAGVSARRAAQCSCIYAVVAWRTASLSWVMPPSRGASQCSCCVWIRMAIDGFCHCWQACATACLTALAVKICVSAHASAPKRHHDPGRCLWWFNAGNLFAGSMYNVGVIWAQLGVSRAQYSQPRNATPMCRAI